MASASRPSDAPLSLSLRIEHWSGVLDVLRESLVLFERRPELVDEPLEAVVDLYHSLAERVESQVSVGDPWDSVVSIPLSRSEANLLMAVLATVESLPVDAEFDDPLPDPEAVVENLESYRLGG